MSDTLTFQVWPGSASIADATSGSVFGFYATDSQYLADAVSSTHWAGYCLGYPVQDVELTNLNFIVRFEEAVSEYSAQVNANNIKEYMLTLQGSSTDINLTGREIRSGLGRMIRLADAYGAEVGVGGDVDWKTGSIDLVAGKQVYDLDATFTDIHESGSNIRIKKIFHDRTPASTRYFDPWALSMVGGVYGMNTLYGFGGNAGVAGNTFLLRPVYEDLLRMQAVEFNDQFRKSAYTFQLINNKLRIFPVPTSQVKLWFHYVVKEDADNAFTSGSKGEGLITDQANVPYQNIIYSNINSVGRQWIKRYFLSLCKITLGGIRAKYTNIPIPNGEVTLDGESLRNEGITERQQLIEEIREMLEKSGKKQQMQNKQEEDENMQKILAKVPMGIFVY